MTLMQRRLNAARLYYSATFGRFGTKPTNYSLLIPVDGSATMPLAMTPQSRRPRPASAAELASKRLSDEKVAAGASMDSMVQAAHEHLVDASPRSCSPGARRRRRDPSNQEDGDEPRTKSDVTRLADHMDSFPLVPLPVIPQLVIADLEKVERGLNELLGSLIPQDSDQQLGRYATRQLSLVQRHLTQQRAQERVVQMLNGDLPVDLAPIGANTLRKSSSTSAGGLTPRSALTSCVSSSSERLRTQVSTTNSLSRVVKCQPDSGRNEAANLHWKSKKAAVDLARAMVQANAARKTTAVAMTSFMISGGDNASRKRRRPRAPTKRTPEEEARYRVQQLERERENRRQAASQRLQARRELQAKKKQENKRHKNEEGGGMKETREGGEEKEKEHKDKDKDKDSDSGSGSGSDSETSDVSNCSESDEANEKAILALDVHIGSSHTRSEPSESDDEADVVKDVYKMNEGNQSSGSKSDDELSKAPEISSSRSVSPDTDGQPSPDLNPEIERQELLSVSAADTAIPDKDQRIVDDTGSNQQQVDESEGGLTNLQQHDPQETIGFNLQSFMASRAAAMLEKLHAQKEAQENVVSRIVFVLAPPVDVSNTSTGNLLVHEEGSFTSLSPPRPEREDCRDTEKSEESLPATPGITSIECTEPCGVGFSDPNDGKRSSWIDEVRQSAVDLRASSPERPESGERALSLPRAPVAECKDYRFYFSNFHCILTSVFEQCRGSSSTSSSSSSLYHRPVGATGEHTMRLQQKLYESWQSIMQDYATVFGPKIVAPEGMVPVAATKPWAPHYRINSTARKEVSEIVTQALQRLESSWEEHPSGLGLKTTWNLLWTWSKPRVERQTLLAWQKVNHFQHAKALTRKDCLKKHIGKYIAAGGRLRQAFDIIPPTFLLPKEYVAFVQAFQERSERLRRSGYSEDKNIWIMKPVALSRGRGISLVNDLSQVIYGEQVVIQEYIAAPRLLDGFKFDLRLYVLVTSFNPLEAFLYDEGFVRLCTRPYEDSDITNIFVHLTNSSIQKDNEEAITGSANPIASALKEENTSNRNSKEKEEGGAAQKDAGGTKTTLAYLWRRLAAEGVDVEQVKRNIEEVVLKALLCGEDQIPFQVNSFDLLGYDILLDTDLRPWLIEINSSPSMARDNDLDYQVKDAMMLDTFRVVEPLHFDRAKLAEVIARRQRDLDDEKRRPHAYTRHPREAEELAARQLNEDLTAILRGKVPRAYGEIPENIGNYRRLCPHTTIYNQLVKLKRSCLRVGERKT